MKKLSFPRELPGRILCCLAVLLIAFLLKRFYSSGDSQSLVWILAPTARLVELFSGLTFVNEPGLGWFNRLHEVVIAPSCSGVNFLIIMFCMSSFQIISSQAAGYRMLMWAGLACLASYAATLLANSVRIWLSILLLRADIYSGCLTPEAVHRIWGVTVYYLFLCFYYLFVSYILHTHTVTSQTPGKGDSRRGRIPVLFIPLVWYLGFSLGVPFLNNAYQQQPDRFIDHSLTVGLTSVLLTAIVLLAVCGCRWAAGSLRNRWIR